MSRLEQTLIEAAEQALLEAKQFSNAPKNDDLFRNLSQLDAYVYIAHLDGSGLSDDGISKLLEIEKQSLEIMKKIHSDYLEDMELEQIISEREAQASKIINFNDL